MTTLYPDQVACAMCGKISEQTSLTSSNSFGAPGLDLRPPEMMRSTMAYWIQTCPHCGYCAEEISQLISDAKSTFDSEEYQKQLKSRNYPELANQVLCQAILVVPRNRSRFPAAFLFKLTAEEGQNLRFQTGITSLYGGRRYLPYAFTEQGLSSVLRSKRAVEVNIAIMRALQFRERLGSNAEHPRTSGQLTLNSHSPKIEPRAQNPNPQSSNQKPKILCLSTRTQSALLGSLHQTL